eukprot:gene2810-5528_t
MSSNWKKLKSKLESTEHIPTNNKKRKRTEINDAIMIAEPKKSSSASQPSSGDTITEAEKSLYLGLDCEMVGLGPSGKMSALARCSLVNYDGISVYDQFVRPKGFVTDFRTKYSGIRSKNLRDGIAISFEQCQADVANLLKGKVLVGHALKNDLAVLLLSQHPSMIRDTARYRPYMKAQGRGGGKFRPRALRDLAKEFLDQEIQTGEHDP